MPAPTTPFALNKQLKYKLFPQKTGERDFWKNLEVNIDAFCDKWSLYEQKLDRLFDEFSLPEQQKIFLTYHPGDTNVTHYLTELMADQKAAIDFYCCLSFAQKNMKILSRYFKVPIRKGKINKSRVFMETLAARKNNKLPELFLLQYAQKKGSAKIPFDFTGVKKIMSFEEAKVFIQKLVRYLNTSDIEGREHLLRYATNIRRCGGRAF